jgi:hypothetical protein
MAMFSRSLKSGCFEQNVLFQNVLFNGRLIVRALIGCVIMVAFTACETTGSTEPRSIFGPQPGVVVQQSSPDVQNQEPTLLGKLFGTAPYALPPVPPMMPDTNDDLALGRFHFREDNYGLAEKHFRLYVEAKPGDAQGWLGLAASYDKLKRFDLADRAYASAIRLVGPRPEILNNRGYSYLLRRDYAKARKDLLSAQTQDRDNPLIEQNIRLLNAAANTRR